MLRAERSLLLDQLLERVVHVLHLGAREGVDIAHADDTVHEGDGLFPVDASVRQSQAGRAGQAEETTDLRLRCGARVAARAESHVCGRVELDRLRRDALGENDTQQLGGREDIAQRLVGVVEGDPAALADRLQAMIVGERLEQPERLERARGLLRGVRDPDALERVLKHGQVETDVVRDEYGVTEARPELEGNVGKGRCIGNVVGRDAVHGGCLRRNLPRRPDEPGVPPRLRTVRIELDQRERDDLVPRRIGAGGLAVEHCVSGRNGRHSTGHSPPGAIGERLDRSRSEEIEDELHGHLSRMSSGSDVTLTVSDHIPP